MESIDEPGCLDRLSNYADTEITAALAEVICDTEEPNGCPAYECDDCPAYELMRQLEYDIQTEVIAFAKKLIADWVEGSS